MGIDSGKMNKYVTLERRGTTRTAVGQQVDTWTTLGKSWCEIKPVTGREFLGASGEQALVTHKIRMRARDDIALAPRDRLTLGSRSFDIQAVLDEAEGGKLWLLMATEQRQTSG